MKHKASPSTLT